jgi:DNA-binding IscR family transcriptional regulator
MPGQWTFLTNYAHVLLCLARDPDATLREVAEQVGITERATHRIVAELEREGAISRSRTGRRNHYEVRVGFALRHPLERHCTVGQLLDLVRNDQRSP